MGTEANAMSGNLICNGRDATKIQTAAVDALFDFKNTYTPACRGVTNGAAAPADQPTECTDFSGKGYTTIMLGTGLDVGMLIVTTQYDDAATDILTNKVAVE